jgi:hypothetical protein
MYKKKRNPLNLFYSFTAQTGLNKLLNFFNHKIKLRIFLGYARNWNNKTYFVLWTINSKLSPQSDHINPAIFIHKVQLCLINNFYHYSYRKRDIQLLLFTAKTELNKLYFFLLTKIICEFSLLCT